MKKNDYRKTRKIVWCSANRENARTCKCFKEYAGLADKFPCDNYAELGICGAGGKK